MSLQRVVLGEVIERPGYGYQLTQRLQERLESAQLKQSTVYPALGALVEKGHIRLRAPAPEEPAIKVPAYKERVWYEATDEGRGNFAEWFGEPLEPKPMRDELRLRMAAARVEDLPVLLGVLNALEQSLMDRLARLAGPAADVDELIAADGDWQFAGRVWLRHTEAAHLSATVDSIHHARRLILAALRKQHGGGDTSRR